MAEFVPNTVNTPLIDEFRLLIGGRGMMIFFRRFFNLYLFWWRHFDKISALEFSIFPVSESKIIIFSVKHRSHFLVPQAYGEALAAMVHFIEYFLFSSFSVQIYFESSVLLVSLGDLKVCL